MGIRISEMIGEIVAALVILAFIIGGIILGFYEYHSSANEPAALPVIPEAVVEAQVDLNSNSEL